MLTITFENIKTYISKKLKKYKKLAKRTKYIKSVIPKNHFHQRTKTLDKHRLIFEKYHNCCLLPKSVIHHIDGNSLNNDPKNLMAFVNNNKHRIYENNCMSRICLKCKSNKTYIDKYGFPQWNKFPNGFMCVKCWCDIGRPKIKNRKFVKVL